MSAYVSERSVGLQDPTVYCEGKDCGRRFSCLGELAGSFTIERQDRDSRRVFSGMNDGTFKVEGFPNDESGARNAAAAEGWIVETVHGKEMDFCPDCKSK